MLSIIHWTVGLVIFLCIIAFRNIPPTLWGTVFRFYGGVMLWLMICYVCNGCPLTYAEILISSKLWGVDPYPNYNFDLAIVKYLVTSKEFYYPLGVALTVQTVKYSINRLYNQ